MKNLSSIAAVTLVSSLALFAAGCDRTPNEPEVADPMVTEPSVSDRMEDAAADTRSTASDMGDSIERSADRAGQAIDDASITAAVKSKYLLDDTLKGLQISVDTDQGVVSLTGTVQNDAAKELATQIAQGTEGVVRVDNQLTTQ